jgi:hypothetical protein
MAPWLAKSNSDLCRVVRPHDSYRGARARWRNECAVGKRAKIYSPSPIVLGRRASSLIVVGSRALRTDKGTKDAILCANSPKIRSRTRTTTRTRTIEKGEARSGLNHSEPTPRYPISLSTEDEIEGIARLYCFYILPTMNRTISAPTIDKIRPAG